MTATCQCVRFGPCTNRMTQEDLRCDDCRKGCTMAMAPEGRRLEDGMSHFCGSGTIEYAGRYELRW